MLALSFQLVDPKPTFRTRRMIWRLWWPALWRLSGSDQRKRKFAIPWELADSRMAALVKRGERALWQVDTAIGLHEDSPARSEFSGPAPIWLFEKFGSDDAIRPEMAEVLTKLAPCG